jgi:hypothetical protein
MNAHSRLLAEMNNRSQKKIANNTYARKDDNNGTIVVKLHDTDIVTVTPDGTVTLDSNGWQTLTTRERMNRYLGDTAHIYQERGIWYVTVHGDWSNPVVYADGMTIAADGAITGAGKDPKVTKKLRDKILKYTKDYANALFSGKVSKPDNGDCWHCCLFSRDTDHLDSHMEEKYYVPSLLNLAVDANPGMLSQLARTIVAAFWYPEQFPNPKDAEQWRNSYLKDSVARKQITKCLRKFMFQYYGLPN